MNKNIRKPEPEIGTDGSNRTWQTRWLPGTGMGSARQDALGLILDRSGNACNHFAVQSWTTGWLPTPGVNTTRTWLAS